MELKFQGEGLGVDCSKSDSCKCKYCETVRYALELLGEVLALAVENNSRDHYNFLVVNIEALAEAAKEELEKRQAGRTKH